MPFRGSFKQFLDEKMPVENPKYVLSEKEARNDPDFSKARRLKNRKFKIRRSLNRRRRNHAR